MTTAADAAIEDEIGPEAIAFAEAAFDAFDPWQVVTSADAAKSAGIDESTARLLISRLKAAKAWPYRGREWRRTMNARGRIGPFGPNRGDWGSVPPTLDGDE